MKNAIVFSSPQCVKVVPSTILIALFTDMFLQMEIALT